MKRKIFYTNIPYYEVFFDQDGGLITYIHEHDAVFRPEYQGALFKHFGIEIEYFKLPEKVFDDIRIYLEKNDVEPAIRRYVEPRLRKLLEKY